MRTTWHAGWLLLTLGALACTSQQADTRVAVTNNGSDSIDAAVRQGEREVSFTGVAAGTTSAYQVANFESFSSVEVAVGEQVSRVDLDEGRANDIVIGEDGRVERVRAPVRVSSGTEGGGW